MSSFFRALPGERIPRELGLGAFALTFALWAAWVGIPLAAVAGFARVAGASDGLLDPSVLQALRMSLFQSALSVAIASVIGVPLGLLAARARGISARLCAWCLEIPFGIPTVVAAMSWVIWLGRSGILASWFGDIGWLYRLPAVVLAHVVYNVPWIALLVSQASREVPGGLLEAASTLGARRASIFRFVIWPEIRWAYYSAALQAFSYCMMSFALVLLLGGGPPVETLETALYARVRSGGALDLEGAAACAIWELAATLVPWGIVLWIRSRTLSLHAQYRQHRPVKFGRAGSRAWGAVGLCALFVMPYLVIFEGMGEGFRGLPEESWKTVLHALGVSIRLGMGSACFAVIAGCVALIGTSGFRSSRIQSIILAMLMAPSGISALVLALGFWLAYRNWVDPFEGSFGAMIVLQATLFFPVVFRILWPVAQKVPLELIDAARGLGASRIRSFLLVDGRRWIVPLLSAFTLVLAASLGEVAAVSFFYSEELVPLSLLVSRWMGQYRFEEARFVAASLLCLSVAAVSWVFLLRGAATATRLHEGVDDGFGKKPE